MSEPPNSPGWDRAQDDRAAGLLAALERSRLSAISGTRPRGWLKGWLAIVGHACGASAASLWTLERRPAAPHPRRALAMWPCRQRALTRALGQILLSRGLRQQIWRGHAVELLAAAQPPAVHEPLAAAGLCGCLLLPAHAAARSPRTVILTHAQPRPPWTEREVTLLTLAAAALGAALGPARAATGYSAATRALRLGHDINNLGFVVQLRLEAIESQLQATESMQHCAAAATAAQEIQRLAAELMERHRRGAPGLG